MLNLLRRTSPATRRAQSLHANLVGAARRPVFFLDLGVADTIDGRFDMVALHAWLVLGRLGTAGQGEVAQALMNTIFVAFDEALRDLGNGDMGMGPRMKKLGNAFNGRCQAYDAAAGDAAAGDETALSEAMLRNVYRGEEGHAAQAARLARYAIAARAKLEAQDPAAGPLDFGTP
ncbi:MAG TPA: ubiquinol-cytochrome C chaperone family protein [Rhizomicrobium sp.]|jgi:cytochrome b pre-mRNA-processing protein 3|nr:ubiquinol-cytochrome C chaperone family protein [Rhizomicrobium sp.]